MSDILVWPYELLVPAECKPMIVPFSRSGGASLGGVTPAIRTDLGWWTVELTDISLRWLEHRRTFDAIAQYLGGRSGIIAVPAWSIDTAPYASGCYEEPPEVPHSDGASFSDGSLYWQGAVSIVSVGVTPIGATTMKLKLIKGAADLSGVRFSYRHALYQTGRVESVDGDVWTVRISPSIRAEIPDGADLEFDRPTCLCRLSSDDGMQRVGNNTGVATTTVSFVEATDVWSRLALGLEA